MVTQLVVQRKKLNALIQRDILPQIKELTSIRIVFIKDKAYVEVDLDLSEFKQKGNALLPDHLDIQVIFECGHILHDKIEFIIKDFKANHREEKMTLLKLLDNLFDTVRKQIITELILAESMFSTDEVYKSLYMHVPSLFERVPKFLCPQIQQFFIKDSQLIFVVKLKRSLYYYLKFFSHLPRNILIIKGKN